MEKANHKGVPRVVQLMGILKIISKRGAKVSNAGELEIFGDT